VIIKHPYSGRGEATVPIGALCLSAAAVQWLRVSPVWEVPKSCTARRGAWADSVSERVCVCQRVCQRVCVCQGGYQRDAESLCVSESAFQRERVCVCDSVSIREPLCCSSAVATGVARMGGAKALLSSARGVGRDGVSERVCVCVPCASLLQQCSGYGCRPYGRCQSPAQLSKGCGQR